MGIQPLVPRMREICGAGNVVTDPLELRTYECDGLTAHRCVPALVVLPSSAAEVAAVVTECARAGVPFVARGSGTGLSGGALPHESGVLIVLSRMRAVVEIDPVSRRAVVEPGVTNLAVSKAAAPFGLFYAPDPSSQVVCSVGGNVAENSGGAHCLKNGFTVHHVTGLEIVTPSGELTWLGDGTGVCSGYDLLGAFTGSEGTLGIVTKIVVKLMPVPEVVHLLLVAYESTAEGGHAVSDIIAAGMLPAAIEMMDALAIEAAEAAVHCNYPAGAGAVLLVELDGPAAEVEAELATVRSLCEKGRRDRDPGGRRPGRARGHLGRAQVGVRRGRPDQPGVHRAGRRGAADLAGRGAGADRVAVRGVGHPGGQRVPRRRREPAPAGAVRRQGAGPGRGGREGIRRHPGRLPGARRLDHRRAWRGGGQVPVHAEDVRRRRPGHHAAGPVRVRPGQPVQPRQDLPHPEAVRGGTRPPPGAAPRRSGSGSGQAEIF